MLSTVRLVICQATCGGTVGMDISEPFGVPGELTPSDLQGNVHLCLLMLSYHTHGSCANSFLPYLKMSFSCIMH